MPLPKRYAGREELTEALRKYPWEDWFTNFRDREKDSDLQLIISHSVGSNIFRAFHHLPEKPSVVFREWAYDSLSRKFLAQLITLNSRTQYRNWAYSVSGSLRKCWKRRMGQEMSYGPSLKLTNLIAKRLCLFKGVPLVKVQKLVWLLEVPLDIYTIQAVANCVPSFPDGPAIGRVPTSATMSFIKNRRMYEAFQEGLYQLTREAGVPAIGLDCLVWDSTH